MASRFYCHVCDSRFNADTPTCPSCQGEFVEQLEEDAERPGDDGIDDGHLLAQQMFALLSQALAPPQMQRQATPTEHQGHAAGDRNVNQADPLQNQAQQQSPGPNFAFSFGVLPGAFPAAAQPPSSSPPGAGGRNASSSPLDDFNSSPLDDFNSSPLDDFNSNPMLRGIASLLSQQFGATGPGSAPVDPLQALFGVLTGTAGANPGDYVFGQQGLDDIISQLMEQTGRDNHPPPASEDTIAKLPKVNYTEASMSSHSPCAICQEVYTEEEALTKLPCEHLFHPPCIEYWLKMNGTCPVCRLSLVVDAETQADNIENLE